MFPVALGGSLVFGAGLLAAASFSEGALVASRTAAQCIGWLFVMAAVVGLTSLRYSSFGKLGAAVVAFLCGLAVLYVAYFEWGEIPDAPIRAAAAEALPAREPEYKVTLASMQIVTPEPKRQKKETRARIAPSQAVVDPCSAVTGVESLQCKRCAEKLGVAWVVCRESARLEYCQGREGDERACPSAIPFSPPG